VSIPPLFLISPFLELNHLSVPIDGLIFVFILIQTQFIALKYQGMNASNILDTVTKDAVIYLALISTSHLLTVILYTVARVGFFAPMLEFNTC